MQGPLLLLLRIFHLCMEHKVLCESTETGNFDVRSVIIQSAFKFSYRKLTCAGNILIRRGSLSWKTNGKLS